MLNNNDFWAFLKFNFSARTLYCLTCLEPECDVSQARLTSTMPTDHKSLKLVEHKLNTHSAGQSTLSAQAVIADCQQGKPN